MSNSKQLPVLSLANASFRLPGQLVHEPLNWQIFEGDLWQLSGLNASGKTSLLKGLVGQFPIINGALTFPLLEQLNPGIPTYKFYNNHIIFLSIFDESKAFLNQSHFYQERFNAGLIAEDQSVAEYLCERKIDLARAETLDLIQAFNLTNLLDQKRVSLSSGQTRRLLLMTAFCQSPNLLLLDEPYLGLDRAGVEELNKQLVLSARIYKTAVVIASATENQGSNSPFKTAIITKRKLLIKNSSDSSIYSSHSFEVDAFSKQIEKIKEIYNSFKPAVLNGPVFEFADVSILYDGKEALSEFNWQIDTGEKWSLIGPNGSGKSTLLSLIFGDHPQAYKNQIKLFGSARGSGESIWDIKQKIGFTSTELHCYLNQSQTCKDYLYTEIGINGLRTSISEDHRMMIKLLSDYFELTFEPETRLNQFSNGEQKLLLFVKAIYRHPEVLLLDEPYQGLDLLNKQKANILLENLLDQEDTLIFITHDLKELPRIISHQKSL